MKDMENETLDGGEVQARTEPSNQGADTSAIDYEALAKALEPTINQLVQRQTQSTKDKRIAGLQGKVADFEAQLAEYQQLLDEGFSKEAAKRLMKLQNPLRDDSEAIAEPANQTPAVTGNQGSNGSGVDADTLEAIGLDPNSPEVTDLLRRGASLQDYVALKVKQTKKPAPTPASVMPTPGQGASTGAEIDDITNRLLTLQREPLKNRSEIAKLSEELRQLQSQR